MRFLYHTQRHTTVGRTPLDEWSARRRDLYLTTQQSQQTEIHATGGIRTHDLSRRAAENLRLRPCGHWDRRSNNKVPKISSVVFFRHPDFLSPLTRYFTYKMKPVQIKAIKVLQTSVTDIQCPRVLCILLVILKNDRCLPEETPWSKFLRGN